MNNYNFDTVQQRGDHMVTVQVEAINLSIIALPNQFKVFGEVVADQSMWSIDTQLVGPLQARPPIEYWTDKITQAAQAAQYAVDMRADNTAIDMGFI